MFCCRLWSIFTLTLAWTLTLWLLETSNQIPNLVKYIAWHFLKAWEDKSWQSRVSLARVSRPCHGDQLQLEPVISTQIIAWMLNFFSLYLLGNILNLQLGTFSILCKLLTSYFLHRVICETWEGEKWEDIWEIVCKIFETLFDKNLPYLRIMFCKDRQTRSKTSNENSDFWSKSLDFRSKKV